MASLVVTNTFAASTVIESAKMNTNFDDIETYINNRNSGAATWDVMNATAATIGALTLTSLNFIPSGTKMVFYQASAPTGWTAVAVNDKFLRVVTAAGTGGTTGGSIAASASLAHTHSISASGTHTHSTPAHVHPLDHDGAEGNSGSSGDFVVSADSDGANLEVSTGTAGVQRRIENQTTSSGSGTSGAGGDHDHGGATGSSGGVYAYADVVIATKD